MYGGGTYASKRRFDGGRREKVAVTEWSALIVRVQVPVPEQSPDHPAKVLPAAGVAVSVTAVPFAKLAEQFAPQSIPAGLLVTVPVPVPVVITVKVGGGGGGGGGVGGGGGGGGEGAVNVAVTECPVLIASVHVPVPEQSPAQPANV